VTSADDQNPHTEIARRFLHERSDAADPQVSPDGAHVACIVSTCDLDENTTRSRVWLDGSPVSAGPHDAQPRWSPDGRWLAFTSRRGEDKGEATLHVLPVDGPGETRTVCTMPEKISNVAWSPDGSTIGFTTRTRDERYEADDVRWQSPRKVERYFSRLNGEDWIFDRPAHVYVVAADGTGTPRNLTPGPFQHSGVAWVHDSSAVITSAQRHDTWDVDLATDLYRIGLDGTVTALTEQTGSYSAASVSPDGRVIAFIGTDDPALYPQNAKVGVMAPDGSQRRWISEGLDRTFHALYCFQPPVWLDDATLLAAAEDRGTVHVYRLTVDGATPEPVTDGQVTVTGFDQRHGSFATTRTDVAHTSELYVERGGTTERVTNIGLAGADWERFTVPCTDGTDEIDAWIMRPAEFDPVGSYPVLLNVHGGPFTQYGEGFFDEAQMQAAAGFVVLMSNPRGGSGRHTEWGQAINGPKHAGASGDGWGSVDVDDVMAVLDAALDRYEFCDRGRVGMLGGSYGGYMATTLAARHGDRFRGICSERAVNNLLTEEWSSDIAMMFRIEHGVDPIEDPEEYVRMSPITFARDIHVPMLLIHSEDDFRCPINQAEELWVVLKWLGRDVTFYRFPGENHELSRSGSPVHRRQRAEIILDWFTDKLAAA
jgi:dipeptidyl aminopeptidase/acylaminoacyl peptidase